MSIRVFSRGGGGAENARPENEGLTLRGLENAGLENDVKTISKPRTKLQGLENDAPRFASHASGKRRLSTRRDSHGRGTVSAGPAITASS